MQAAALPGGDSDTGRQSSGEKMLAVLLALGQLGQNDGRGEVRLADLVELTGHPRPTVHRLLAQLKQAGFVEQEVSGPYRLGPKILLLAAQCLGGHDVRRIANPLMQEFCERFGHTLHLGIRDGVEVAYIDKVNPAHGMQIGSTIGQRRPLPVTALGKALLAHASPSLVEEVGRVGWPHRTNNTLPDLPALQRALAEVRAAGFAIDNEESDLGLRCAAAPILNHVGAAVAAISVTTLVSQVGRRDLDRLGRELVLVAGEITRRLGG